ncbi:integrase [Aurantimicrobium minutum]|uniref:tyrosine-type recombinase/integrase n=1 Tax=Aurantimicrobium minutum TaxID=708131 RepID=UPI0024749A08|nr:tyrosine-type recombinase/integrase [Aurantimicrobium minutum]MDH6409644.1 integrase [Aurantimicrobium minutum]
MGAYGQGSVYKKQTYILNRKTGEKEPHSYWQAARIVHLTDGTRKRLTGTSQVSQQLAFIALEKNIAKFRAEYEAGDYVPRQAGKKIVTLNEALDGWLLTKEQAEEDTGPSDIVLRKYKRWFEMYVREDLGERNIAELTDEDFRQQFTKLRNLKKVVNGQETDQKLLQSSARRNIFKALNAAMKYAVAKGYIKLNPMALLTMPKQSRPPNENVPQQAHIAIALLKRLQDENHPAYCRMLLQFMGLRRSERLGITFSNLTLTGKPSLVIDQQLARHDDGSGWYIKESTKNGKERTLPIPEPFLSALKAYVKERRSWEKSPEWNPDPRFADLLFLQPNGKLINPNRDNNDWHEILKSHDFPYWRAHLNRHITATLMADIDPPVSMEVVKTLLGNSAAMAAYYARVTDKQMRKPMDSLGEDSFGILTKKKSSTGEK